MIINSLTDSVVVKFMANPCSRWKFGNKILYDMCAENPLHNDIDIVVGKIWLIGRSYSAAIERRKGEVTQSENFYYEIVAPKLLAVGQELDERIKRLNCYQCPTEHNLGEILNTHKFLMDVFYDITELNKRSLASKYLHFHCPRLFYIYDSRSNQKIKKYVKLDKRRLSGCSFFDYDMMYTDFCARMLELQEYIKISQGKLLSPRDIDNLLLYF